MNFPDISEEPEEKFQGNCAKLLKKISLSFNEYSACFYPYLFLGSFRETYLWPPLRGRS